jgi:hypothetical protein
VRVNENTVTEPNSERVALYEELFDLQNEVSAALRKSFSVHRNIVSRDGVGS